VKGLVLILHDRVYCYPVSGVVKGLVLILHDRDDRVYCYPVSGVVKGLVLILHDRVYCYLVRVCSDSNPPKSDKLTAITAG